jgi:hypothetical protein
MFKHGNTPKIGEMAHLLLQGFLYFNGVILATVLLDGRFKQLKKRGDNREMS